MESNHESDTMDRRLTLVNMTRNQVINVQFRDLSYTVQLGYRKPQKQILKGLNGFFRANELTAIMGPSGSGKSTLLNILSGFQEGKYTGTVEYVDNEGKQNSSSGSKETRKQLCYIQQTDSLHGFFTVYEIMMITSYLKLNRLISHESRKLLIADILEMLKLSQTKETRVNRLSGGQKKRLSIALELIDNPPLMFLDEPTTGLDSLAAMQCVTVLKTIAQAGRTIICTIHQPSATTYQMFDHIYLLVDGNCMYHSSPNNTIEYFAQQGFQCPQYHNPADYMLEVVTREYGNYDEQLIAAAKYQDWPKEKCSRKSSNVVEKVLNDQMLRPPSELTRFWILLRRCAILAHRDHSTVHIKLILHFLVAVLLGLLFEHVGSDGSKTISNISYLQVSALYMFYTGMMPAVLKFPLEINILRKERFNNWYQLRTYYMAAIVCTVPFQIIFAFIYSFISYFMSNQPLEFSRFFMYLLIASLTNFTSDALGMGLGAMFSPINGTFVGSIIISIMLAFTGFLIFFKHMSKFFNYISYLNVHRYIFDGMVYAIYNHREKLPCPTNYCHYRLPSLIMEELDLSKSVFWLDVVILFGYLVAFRVLTYILLKRRLSKID